MPIFRIPAPAESIERLWLGNEGRIFADWSCRETDMSPFGQEQAV